MGVKYYGTERPMSMGAFLKNPADNQLLSVMNFDEKTFCPVTVFLFSSGLLILSRDSQEPISSQSKVP